MVRWWARELWLPRSQRQGLALLDSGALYRIIAVVALRQGVSPSDAALLAALCSELQIVFVQGR